MSNLKVTLYRADDQRILKVLLVLKYEKKHDYSMISFKCGTETINILSTSSGNIDKEGNVKTVEPEVQLFVDYCESTSKLECLVGHYRNNELLDYETLTAYFDNTQIIKAVEATIPHLRTIPAPFRDRFEDFFSALSRRKSSWNIQVSCQGDVLLDIVSRSNTSAMVTFGENTKEVLASDYVFRLDPSINKLILPMEIVQKYKHTPQCQLGVFEVIKPDFLGTQGVYYKNLISNLIELSDIS